jgi:ubiquinone/menaquinone biosynthesis C-methylase UbiE
MLDPDIQAHYQEQIREQERLLLGTGTLELVRTRELLRRYLPAPPATVLDVGGGPGVYASWLARAGYTIRLLDPVPLHVEQASAASAAQPDHPFSVSIGDARRLDEPDAAFDTVLLMGPLYHLTERGERLAALAEARRVLRPGGRLCVVGISRFASLLDGLRMGALPDPAFGRVVERDLRDGQHRNPDPERHPEWFTTAFLHHPDELADEVAEAGFRLVALLGIEGPGWLLPDRWTNPEQRPSVLYAARAIEQEPSLLGLSAHLLAVVTAP